MWYGANVSRKCLAAAITATRRAQHSWGSPRCQTLRHRTLPGPTTATPPSCAPGTGASPVRAASARGAASGLPSMRTTGPSSTRLRTPRRPTTSPPFCADCHCLTTTTRRFTRAGGSRYLLLARFSEAVTKCELNTPLPASRPSSCTTSRPDSTREVLSAVRSQRLRQRRAVTAPTSTTSGSRSSGVSSPSISALTASPRYRRQRFGP